MREKRLERCRMYEGRTITILPSIEAAKVHFDESEHPRESGGKFAEGSGGSSSKSESVARKVPEKGKIRLASISRAESKALSLEEVTRLKKALIAGRSSARKLKQGIQVSLGAKLRKAVSESECHSFLKVAEVFLDKMEGQVGVKQLREIAKKNGEHDAVAALLVSSWASSSGDSEALPVAIQMAAEALFDMRSCETAHLKSKAQAGKILRDHGHLIKEFLMAQYEETQAFLKRNGIKHVTLFRGADLGDNSFDRKLSKKFDQFTDKVDKISESDISEKALREAETTAGARAFVWGKARLQPISSFSASMYTATEFGNHVFAVRVPASRVLSTYVTGFGCSEEDEVTVLGGKYRVKAAVSDLLEEFENIQSLLKKAIGASSESAVSIVGSTIASDVEDEFEDDPEDEFDIDLDSDIKNADWPKRTDDRLGAFSEEEEEEVEGEALAPPIKIVANSDFDESEHPRDEDGKWSSRGGGASRDDDGVWRDPKGKALPKRDQERLKAAGTPPAWKDVKLNPDPDGHLQVVGTDKKGKRQPRYSAKHKEGASQKKFKRLKAFAKALPALRKAMAKDYDSSDPRTRETARCLMLIDKTGMRAGGREDTGADKDAYGASTLLVSHVKVSGDTCKLGFTGKKGVDISLTVKDRELADMFKDQMKGKKGKDEIFPETSDRAMRRYLKQKTGRPLLTKDFRTYVGTSLALKKIHGMDPPTSESALKKAKKEVATVVAAQLGNTPSVALGSYIAPEAFSAWEEATWSKKGKSVNAEAVQIVWALGAS